MLARSTQGTFAEGRASYVQVGGITMERMFERACDCLVCPDVQNLLWFAALSVSELKANMVDFIRRRHTVERYAADTAPSRHEQSSEKEKNAGSFLCNGDDTLRCGGESVYGLDFKAAVAAAIAEGSPPKRFIAPRPTPSQNSLTREVLLLRCSCVLVCLKC